MKNKLLIATTVAVSTMMAIPTVDAATMSVERQQELCNKSKKKVWDDFTETCVPENPCEQKQVPVKGIKNGYKYEPKHEKYLQYCDMNTFSQMDLFSYDDFNRPNVATNVEEVIDIMNFYVKNRKGWEWRCDPETVRYTKERYYGDNFIGCKFGPHYMAFNLGSMIGVDNKKAAGYCYAIGGRDVFFTFTMGGGDVHTVCDGVSKESCDALGGEYQTKSGDTDVKWCLFDL